MSDYVVHVCTFSALDDIPKRLKGDQYRTAVRETLRTTGKFSCFEVTTKLAKVLDDLKASGEIEFVNDEKKYAFPWVGVRVVTAKP